jgi:hypothetical protein
MGNLLEYTQGVIFLGSPLKGSSIASWAHPVARALNKFRKVNVGILNALQANEPSIADMQASFSAMLSKRNKQFPPIKIKCFKEELPTPTIGLVSCSIEYRFM